MLNFTIKTPTEVVFGRDIEDGIGERIKEYGAHRVLVHFGGALVNISVGSSLITIGAEGTI